MGDPPRLLGSTNEGDQWERELLGSLRDVGPRPGAKAETWNRLAVQAAAVATVGAASTALHGAARTSVAAAAQGTKMLAAKIAAGVAIVGSTAAGGAWWVHQRAVVPSAPPVVQVAPPFAAVAEPPQVDEGSALPPVAPADPALPAPPKAADRTAKGADESRARGDALVLESRMLTEARAQLHAGDPRAAQATLEKLRARSPKGLLTQERDVLAIQISSALGDASAAKRKAKAFLDAYPESPHAAQLRRLATDP